MSTLAIDVEGISKKYTLGGSRSQTFMESLSFLGKKPSIASESKEFWALRNVSFQVEKGQALGIIGKNGAGKSTLLKILSRITPPTQGTITLEGRVASLLEVGTGFHQELTGRQNIFLNGTILGMKKAEITSKLDEIIAFSGIEKFIDTPVKRYSSGMYVRLAFAVAAHLEPEILIIDEVLAVGDLEFQKKCLGKMGEVAKSGRTILFVSHNMSAVSKLCEKALVMHMGEVAFYGSTTEGILSYNALTNPQNLAKPALRIDRIGNGSMRIQNVYIASKDDVVLDSISAGMDVKIVLEYETFEKISNIKDLKVSVTLYHFQSGDLLTLHNNLQVGYTISNVFPKGAFELTIHELPLNQGTYNIGASIMWGRDYIDCVEDIFQFEVFAGDFYNYINLPQPNEGKILLKANWLQKER